MEDEEEQPLKTVRPSIRATPVMKRPTDTEYGCPAGRGVSPNAPTWHPQMAAAASRATATVRRQADTLAAIRVQRQNLGVRVTE